MIRRRRAPIEVAYRGYAFTVTDFGDRTCRFGVRGISMPGESLLQIRDEAGFLSLTPGGALRKALRAIDDHLARRGAR